MKKSLLFPLLGVLYLFLPVMIFAEEKVVMHYDTVQVCLGNEFSMSDFLRDHVEVPLDCQLLGWEGAVAEKITPLEDTIYHVLYRHGESVYRLPFVVMVRQHPKVELLSLPGRLCSGDNYPSIPYQVHDCDRYYFQSMETGERHNQLSDFGLVPQQESVRFYLVGSNEQCPEISQVDIAFDIINPSRYRLSATLPPSEYSICGDSVWLCDFMDCDPIKLYYGDEWVGRYSQHELDFLLSWEQEDSLTRCEDWIRTSYTNNYHIQARATEPVCHTSVVLDEVYEQHFICTGDSVQEYGLSYSCSSGRGYLYLGCEYPLLDVQFFPLYNTNAPIPVLRFEPLFNMDTYHFPYRSYASICWGDSEILSARYKVELYCLTDRGDTLMYVDTLSIEKCQPLEPIIKYDCQKSGDSFLTMASNDSIVDVMFLSEEEIDWQKVERQNSVPDYYAYASSYQFDWKSILSDSLHLEVDLSFMDCSSSVQHTFLELELYDCRSLPRVYYGAFTSSKSILLQREECLTHQCSNEEGSLPDTVRYQLDCVGDTLYLKFKGVDFPSASSYWMTFSFYDYWIVYPSAYEKSELGVRFYNDGWNPTIAYVPTKDELVTGTFNDVPFAFYIEVADSVVKQEHTICRGETLDLNELIREEQKSLSWNVENTNVSPDMDTDYYLYGFTAKGCLVDERVRVHVDAPLWYRLMDDQFCQDTWVHLSDYLNTNARQTLWSIDGGELWMGEDRIYMDTTMSLFVQLSSLCDTVQYELSFVLKDCEEAAIQECVIPSLFTPNGDGYEDVWIVDLPQASTWNCQLYDRFGKLLRLFVNEKIEWDGTYMGVPQPSTDYWYVLWVDDAEEARVGHFTLRR